MHAQEVSIVDSLGREVELICHDDMSGDPSLEAGCLIVEMLAGMRAGIKGLTR